MSASLPYVTYNPDINILISVYGMIQYGTGCGIFWHGTAYSTVSHTACNDEFRQNIRSHSWMECI